MHRLAAGFVLGYHGCTRSAAEALLRGKPFKRSQNDYDWLGAGIYFWEANPSRGLEFAREKLARASIRSGLRRSDVTVIGAVIDLGLCLDLTTKAGISHVKGAYTSLRTVFDAAGEALPVNSAKLPLRKLDCAVVNHLHQLRRNQGEPPVQTVRGVFVEGEGIYPGAGFAEKTHIQIAVVDSDCIKGVFRVRPVDLRA